MKSVRKKRQQDARRLQRNLMQNHMVLHGWVPVKCGTDYGIAHAGDQLLVLRCWGEQSGFKAANAQHQLHGGWQGAAAKRSTTTPRTGWRYVAVSIGAQASVRECAWAEMQAQWVRGLQAYLRMRRWL